MFRFKRLRCDQMGFTASQSPRYRNPWLKQLCWPCNLHWNLCCMFGSPLLQCFIVWMMFWFQPKTVRKCQNLHRRIGSSWTSIRSFWAPAPFQAPSFKQPAPAWCGRQSWSRWKKGCGFKCTQQLVHMTHGLLWSTWPFWVHLELVQLYAIHYFG